MSALRGVRTRLPSPGNPQVSYHVLVLVLVNAPEMLRNSPKKRLILLRVSLRARAGARSLEQPWIVLVLNQ